MQWYLSNLKSDREKLKLITNIIRSNNQTIWDRDIIKKKTAGAILFMETITPLNDKCCAMDDIKAWSLLLQKAIESKYYQSSLIQIIMDKFKTKKEKKALLLTRNDYDLKNALHITCSSTSIDITGYAMILKLIDENTRYLLKEPDYLGDGGNTPLHLQINDKVRGAMLLEKIDNIQETVLNTKNDCDTLLYIKLQNL